MKKETKKKISGFFKKDCRPFENEDNSRFYLNNIGPEIAKLLTLVEGTDYHYKTIKYKGVKHYVEHYDVDKVYYNGMCSIISTKDNLEILENDDIGSFFDGKDTICLATSDFNFPPFYYDGKLYQIPRVDYSKATINFYDNEGTKLFLFKEFPYIYDFINLAMQKQAESPNEYLSRAEYNDLIYEVMHAELLQRYNAGGVMQRKRINHGSKNE